jgi:hypothetical protein
MNMATSLQQLDDAIALLLPAIDAIIVKAQQQPNPVDYTKEVTDLQGALSKINAVLNPPPAV